MKIVLYEYMEGEEHPLVVYERYAEDLDNAFEDNLIVEYSNVTGIPIFKVLYEDVDREILMKSIPVEWKQLAKEGKITLDIREYTENCPEHQDAKYITEVLMKDQHDNLMAKIKALMRNEN